MLHLLPQIPLLQEVDDADIVYPSVLSLNAALGGVERTPTAEQRRTVASNTAIAQEKRVLVAFRCSSTNKEAVIH